MAVDDNLTDEPLLSRTERPEVVETDIIAGQNSGGDTWTYTPFSVVKSWISNLFVAITGGNTIADTQIFTGLVRVEKATEGVNPIRKDTFDTHKELLAGEGGNGHLTDEQYSALAKSDDLDDLAGVGRTTETVINAWNKADALKTESLDAARKLIKPITDDSIFGGGDAMPKQLGHDYVIDAKLTGFDTVGRYYGIGIIRADGACKIYEVDINGSVLDPSDTNSFECNVIDEKDDFIRISGESGSGGYGSADLIVNRSLISIEYSGISSKFSNDIYESHYGMLYQWDELPSDIDYGGRIDYLENYRIPNSDISSEKMDMTTSVDVIKLTTSENVLWNINDGYDSQLFSVWYEPLSRTNANNIQIPLPKNRADNDIVGGISVRIAINGSWIYRYNITNAELVSFGVNILDRGAQDSMFHIDIPNIILEANDIVYVAWSCDNPLDRITFQYDNNDPAGTHYANRYIYNSDTSVNDLIDVPPPQTGDSWTYPVIFTYRDYVKKKIQDENSGGNKPIIANVFPDKIYTVADDLNIGNSGFDTVNYSAMLYTDHLLNLINPYSVIWEKTNTDHLPIFSPMDDDGIIINEGVDVLTTPIFENIGGDINPSTISFDHISTKSSVGELSFPKVLFIGDSVTNQFLANTPMALTEDNPVSYWSYIKKLFTIDAISKGSGHNMLSMGVESKRSFDVGGNTIKSYAEGRGGWDTRDFLYQMDFTTDNNRFYDSSKIGTVKFSISKYLERFKTLADDGETRLTVGVDAGTEVTDSNSHDLCTPTHVVIQLGFNDIEANWSGDIDLMIAEIKAEYPNMIVIISTIDSAGTFFPNLYPQLDYDGINMMNNSLHVKMYNLVGAAKSKEDLPNKIFYCPSYFVQPTAWGVAYREVNPPEYMVDPLRFIYKSAHGAGNTYHPNTFAHAAWGYQMYSIIKYSLSL